MPGNDERRPTGGPASSKGHGDDLATETDSSQIAAQIHRRREASLRLVPLADGRRDPWDPYPGDAPLKRRKPPRPSTGTSLRIGYLAGLRDTWRSLRALGVLTPQIEAELQRLADEREVA